jgi:glycosyltransferase involved in cell wall biosynthesis
VLVPPGDPEALAGALLDLLPDAARRAAMGEAGRERAVGRYSWRVTAEATAEQYREVIELHRQGAAC